MICQTVENSCFKLLVNIFYNYHSAANQSHSSAQTARDQTTRCSTCARSTYHAYDDEYDRRREEGNDGRIDCWWMNKWRGRPEVRMNGWMDIIIVIYSAFEIFVCEIHQSCVGYFFLSVFPPFVRSFVRSFVPSFFINLHSNPPRTSWNQLTQLSEDFHM